MAHSGKGSTDASKAERDHKPKQELAIKTDRAVQAESIIQICVASAFLIDDACLVTPNARSISS